MKKIIIVAFFIFSFTILYSLWEAFRPNTTIPLLQNYQKQDAKLGTKMYTLYIADTPNKQEQGLSNVKAMPENVGMIFIFKKPGSYFFWMKDMKFPLDFVYIRNNKVVDLMPYVRVETYPNAFTAKVPFDSVIELNSGEISASNVLIHDKLTY